MLEDDWPAVPPEAERLLLFVLRHSASLRSLRPLIRQGIELALPTLCYFPSGWWTQADVRRLLRTAIRGVLQRAASIPPGRCEAWQAQQGARAA